MVSTTTPWREYFFAIIYDLVGKGDLKNSGQRDLLPICQYCRFMINIIIIPENSLRKGFDPLLTNIFLLPVCEYSRFIFAKYVGGFGSHKLYLHTAKNDCHHFSKHIVILGCQNNLPTHVKIS